MGVIPGRLAGYGRSCHFAGWSSEGREAGRQKLCKSSQPVVVSRSVHWMCLIVGREAPPLPTQVRLIGWPFLEPSSMGAPRAAAKLVAWSPESTNQGSPVRPSNTFILLRAEETSNIKAWQCEPRLQYGYSATHCLPSRKARTYLHSMAAGLTLSEPIIVVSDDKKEEVESQSQNGPQVDLAQPPQEPTSDSTSSDHDHDDLGLSDNSNVPKMSYLRLFWFFFYNFGLFAWGGPVAQIALIKDKLVVQDKWTTLARFQRVFSVYQILPGPEAAELCMFFGCLSAGRIGGIIAGVAFALPGFVLMLLASYLYSLAGFENKYFNASFRALQPIVAAMVGDHTRSDTTFL